MFLRYTNVIIMWRGCISNMSYRLLALYDNYGIHTYASGYGVLDSGFYLDNMLV